MDKESLKNQFGAKFMPIFNQAEKIEKEIDVMQFQKLVNLFNFFQDYIVNDDDIGQIELLDLSASGAHGGFGVMLHKFSAGGPGLENFAMLLKGASTFNIESFPDDDNVYIALIFFDIFK